VVAFALALAALIGGAVGVIGWIARDNYFVGIADGQLTIYQGRPGGVLWFRPTVVERTEVSENAVLQSRLSDLQSGKEEPSLSGARQYVDNLRSEAIAHGVGADTTTSTTTAPTTTVPAVAPTAVPAAVPAPGTTVPAAP
jgi:protein phosphatase